MFDRWRRSECQVHCESWLCFYTNTSTVTLQNRCNCSFYLASLVTVFGQAHSSLWLHAVQSTNSKHWWLIKWFPATIFFARRDTDFGCCVATIRICHRLHKWIQIHINYYDFRVNNNDRIQTAKLGKWLQNRTNERTVSIIFLKLATNVILIISFDWKIA